jgi:Zn-dependent protease
MGLVSPVLCVFIGVRLFGWRMGLAQGGLLMLSLLMHEVGHMMAATALGVPVKEFGLCLKGAYIRREYATRRRDEIFIAAAGPLMNIFLMYPLMFLPNVGPEAGLNSLLLGVVNLIPFPSSDGLRIFRNLINSVKARAPILPAAQVGPVLP